MMELLQILATGLSFAIAMSPFLAIVAVIATTRLKECAMRERRRLLSEVAGYRSKMSGDQILQITETCLLDD